VLTKLSDYNPLSLLIHNRGVVRTHENQTIAAKKDETMEVKVGDTVFYGKYAGTELSIDGVDYLLLNQTDVLYIA